MDAPQVIEYLTTEEVGRLLRCSPSALRTWRFKRVGPPWMTTGRKVLYKRSDIDGWMETQYVPDQLHAVGTRAGR